LPSPPSPSRRPWKQRFPAGSEGGSPSRSVIEEECTGKRNAGGQRGQGVLADAAVLLETHRPRSLLLGGVGILWAELTVARACPPTPRSRAPRDQPGAHGAAADRQSPGARNPRWRPALDGPFAQLDHACNVSVGVFRAGRLGPPASRGRPPWGSASGFRPAWTARRGAAASRSRGARRRGGRPLGWPSIRPSVRPAGFRAEGYLIDAEHPLVAALAFGSCRRATGRPPRCFALGSTTDARALYLNQFRDSRPSPYGPAGPQHPRRRRVGRTRQHRGLGRAPWPRFLAGYYAAGGLRTAGRRHDRPAGRLPRPPSRRPPAVNPPRACLAPMTVRTTGERIAERFVTAIAPRPVRAWPAAAHRA